MIATPFFDPSAVRQLAGRGGAFARWFFAARTKYTAHSPFLYDFATEALEGNTPEICRRIELRRRTLAKSAERFSYRNEGAGKRKDYDSIAAHARRSSARLPKGAFLHRLFRYYQPDACLELGANLGISAAYMLSGHPSAKFVTVEADSRLCEIARETLGSFDLTAAVVNATFTDFLSEDAARWDFAYLDGHHAFEPVMAMLDKIAPRMNEGGFILIDDIYWSAGMIRAWREARELNGVALSIDLFHSGLLVFQNGELAAHYKLRKNLLRP